MNKSESITNLVAATIAVMQEVKGVEKTMKIGTGDNSYQGIADQEVKKVVGESMAKNGLVIYPIGIEQTTKLSEWDEVDPWSKSTPKDMKRKQSVFTEVKNTYLLCHTSGEFIELQGLGQGVDPQDKGAGKACTYSLKYVLLYTFLVPTGKIDDSDKEHSDEKPVPQGKPQQPAQPKTPAPVKKEPVKLIHNSDKYKSAITAMTEGIKGKVYTIDELKSMYTIDQITEECLIADVAKFPSI
jgi:hypothetical protein